MLMTRMQCAVREERWVSFHGDMRTSGVHQAASTWQIEVQGNERKAQSLDDDGDRVHIGLPNTIEYRSEAMMHSEASKPYSQEQQQGVEYCGAVSSIIAGREQRNESRWMVWETVLLIHRCSLVWWQWYPGYAGQP